MNWWIWALSGLALAVVELGSPSFFMMFLAVGAFASMALLLVSPDAPLWGQMLVFSLCSVVSLLLFRKPLMRHFNLDKPAPSREEIVNETATPNEDIAPGGLGKAELRGTVWSARNGGDATLAKGQPCKVERVEGLTLWLKAE
jgi:membrane protein implicated in regulation of membrane protease activity